MKDLNNRVSGNSRLILLFFSNRLILYHYVLFLNKCQFVIRLEYLFACKYLAVVVLDILRCVCLFKMLLNTTLQYYNGGTNQPSVFRISVLIVTLK